MNKARVAQHKQAYLSTLRRKLFSSLFHHVYKTIEALQHDDYSASTAQIDYSSNVFICVSKSDKIHVKCYFDYNRNVWFEAKYDFIDNIYFLAENVTNNIIDFMFCYDLIPSSCVHNNGTYC
jgi:hypothetical protein